MACEVFILVHPFKFKLTCRTLNERNRNQVVVAGLTREDVENHRYGGHQLTKIFDLMAN